MKIEIAKSDLWWLREVLRTAIDHMERQPDPSAFSKMPSVARKTYRKLSLAMKEYDSDKAYFPLTASDHNQSNASHIPTHTASSGRNRRSV